MFPERVTNIEKMPIIVFGKILSLQQIEKVEKIWKK